jgi:molecular chaperone GrpE
MSKSESNISSNQSDETINSEAREFSEPVAGSDEDDSSGSSSDLSVQMEESKQKYLYLLSEFETYKRRMARERLDLFRNAGKDLIVELLPVLDDFERGLDAMEQSMDVVAIREGVDLVYQKFKNLLVQKGLQPIVSVGAEFDTEKHEAVSQMPASSPEQVNRVVAEVEKGYFLNEQVLRFAKVIVGV